MTIRRRWWLTCLTTAISLSALSPLATAGTIFDDDYIPPSAKTPPSVPPPPPPSIDTPPPPTPLPPPTAPQSPATSPITQPAARKHVPSPAAQAVSRKLLKEVFAKQLADRAPAARRSLARQFLDHAARIAAENPTDQFVLLAGARQSAMEGDDWELALRATDAMAAAFNADALAAKLDAIAKVPAKADDPVVASVNCRAGLALIDQLLAADDYATAVRVATQLQPATPSDPLFAIVLPRRLKDLAPLPAEYERLHNDVEKLRANPADPAANLALGAFLCFHKGDWPRGLPMLAKGSDPTLQTLAKDDLSHAADPSPDLADGWWDLADKRPERDRPEIRDHAAATLQRALPSTTGLRRSLWEKRLAATPRRQLIDLLAKADPTADAAAGRWSTVAGDLLSDDGRSRFEFPYRPPPAYWVRVEFTRTAGGDGLDVSIPRGADGAGCWTVGGWGNTRSIFHALRDFTPEQNPTSVMSKAWLETGRRAVTCVEVKGRSLRAWLDGRFVTQLQADPTDLHYPHPNGEIAPHDLGRLAVGTWLSPMTIHHADVLELDARGDLLR